MKGSPSNPQCGFSKFAIEILKFYEIPEIHYVNILSDPELKEMVKEITQWNTFPQVFANGELIGGSDILMEMHKDGLLKEALLGK